MIPDYFFPPVRRFPVSAKYATYWGNTLLHKIQNQKKEKTSVDAMGGAYLEDTDAKSQCQNVRQCQPLRHDHEKLADSFGGVICRAGCWGV